MHSDVTAVKNAMSQEFQETHTAISKELDDTHKAISQELSETEQRVNENLEQTSSELTGKVEQAKSDLNTGRQELKDAKDMQADLHEVSTISAIIVFSATTVWMANWFPTRTLGL